MASATAATTTAATTGSPVAAALTLHRMSTVHLLSVEFSVAFTARYLALLIQKPIARALSLGPCQRVSLYSFPDLVLRKLGRRGSAPAF
jgi:hypothetical protein